MHRPTTSPEEVAKSAAVRRLISMGLSTSPESRVTRYNPISMWEIDMEYRHGRSDINEISIGISIWDMGYRLGIWYIAVVI